MNKRIITPHKGGRTARLEFRLRPDIRAKLRQIARPGESAADVLERLIEQEYALISASTLASRSPG